MSTVSDLLTLFAILAAVQFVALSLRNSRDAIRLVPIGSVTPSIVREYKTVPLCFVGGETLLTNIVKVVYGNLWLLAKARKQAALCDRIVFLNRDYMPLDREAAMEAGMIAQAIASEGEDSTHIRRSARRCRRGTELVLAMLFPTEDGQRYETPVRCVAVRSRARPVRDTNDRVEPTRGIEWEVLDPIGLGASVDSSLERHEVPLSAFWLASQEHDGEGVPVRLRVGDLSYRYGANRWCGLLSWGITNIFRLVLPTGGVVVVAVALGIHRNYLQSFTIQAVSLVLFYSIVISMARRFLGFPYRSRAQGPRVRGHDGLRGIWTGYHAVPWHGSTRRSLAVGNRIRGVGVCRQFVFLYWKPLLKWLLHIRRRLRGS